MQAERWLSGGAGKISVSFQPIFSLENGCVVIHEALLRAQSLVGKKSVHPELLDCSERWGFTKALDLSVLAMTFDALRQNEGMIASVNFSQSSIDGDSTKIIEALRRSGLANRVIVEITERGRAGRKDLAYFADQVREIGSAIAVDDYETGCADDALVCAVRPSIIKVVLDDVEDTSIKRMARATNACAEFGAKLVVEKIDSRRKYDFAMKYGASYLQGFLLCHPVLAGELPASRLMTLHARVPSHQCATTGVRGDATGASSRLAGNKDVGFVEKP